MNDYLSALDAIWSSSFWSTWVIVLVCLNYGTMLFLLLWAPWVKIPMEEDGTTGHIWSNGLVMEGLHKLPKWWFLLSTAAFIFMFVYLTLYPGFGKHKGTLDWTSHKEHDAGIAAINAKQAHVWQAVEEGDVLSLVKNDKAMHVGRRLFEDNCAACHSYDAKGNHIIGAPNLTDNTWLYGGSVDAIKHSITEGRHGVMPPWESSFDSDQIKDIAHYVLSLSDAEHDSDAAQRGQPLFATCAGCHSADGSGNQALGAPNLADNVWKYDGSLEGVIHTIKHGRRGHMPAWKDRLNEREIKVLTAWVLSHDNTKEAENAQ